MLTSRAAAYQLLDELNAPSSLKVHVRLVAEAADLLLDHLADLGVVLDDEFVRIGVAIHDVGKIAFPAELREKGAQHEAEGQRMLLSMGVEPRIARCCVSHAQFETMECSTEELIVALSDKLWKGNRNSKLELRVIDAIAARVGQARWDVFEPLDRQFEAIASAGHERLQRSVVPE